MRLAHIRTARRPVVPTAGLHHVKHRLHDPKDRNSQRQPQLTVRHCTHLPSPAPAGWQVPGEAGTDTARGGRHRRRFMTRPAHGGGWSLWATGRPQQRRRRHAPPPDWRFGITCRHDTCTADRPVTFRSTGDRGRSGCAPAPGRICRSNARDARRMGRRVGAVRHRLSTASPDPCCKPPSGRTLPYGTFEGAEGAVWERSAVRTGPPLWPRGTATRAEAAAGWPACWS